MRGGSMGKQQALLPDEVVKKSNAIARARWQPESVWEPRIVALVASKVRTDDEDFQTYRIPVAELTGISDENLSGYQYQEIRKCIIHLAKATILIQGENNQRNFMAYPIFSACGYEDGYLIARFDPDLKPHFLNLREQFTEYSLMQFLMLQSGYSQRIFEFLKSWSNVPEVIITVEELHNLLNTPPSFRSDFRQFRTRVIEKAYKDIHKKTSLHFEWEPIKIGRSVEKIRFLFSNSEFIYSDCEKKKERQRQLQNQRLLRAIACANKKNGACTVRDNRPIICKTCLKFLCLEDIRSK